ncbi:substrate carrier family protein a [Anaeramoeba flamelloides]|uniref:Substrate carrier family protein a n=1 Tax=Anaeramoeba flamelloides TaxID=1746091 RepID=A0AAV7YPQ3_9EUKA|nr:substrate carrier family protein a [Anaeramoeba flamelloides]KAJ6249123.1 substrate carrier family protein a [Anaeramoeba flamelloides]
MSLGNFFARKVISETIEESKPVTSKDKGSMTPFQHLITGGIAGIIARTITSPLDVIKIIFQVHKGPSEYNGIFDAFGKIYQKQGLAGFWRGNLAGCARIAPYSAAKFFSYDKYSKIIGKGKPLTNSQRLIAGSLAGATGVMITYPFDLIKTRMTVSDEYQSIAQSFFKIMKEENVQGLYRGIVPTLCGIIPYEGGQFLTYGSVKKYLEKKLNRPLSVGQNLIVGAFSGAFAQTVAYPFDIIRKRLMVSDEYKGMFDCAHKIITEEGFKALYRGNVSNIIKVIPYAGLTFLTYEQVKGYFDRKNMEKIDELLKD